jgi:serine/threonine protein phosphatase PrpC
MDAARDMKATDSCEIARIARAGGHVSNGRVNGSLAIARAIGATQRRLLLLLLLLFVLLLLRLLCTSTLTPLLPPPVALSCLCACAGDKSLKKGPSPVLTAEPEIVTFRFQAEDEFLLLASDGLWDVMTSQVSECVMLRSDG